MIDLRVGAGNTAYDHPKYYATEAVKGQDTASRREGAKERAADKKSGKILKNTLDSKHYATQQKKSIEWHDKRTKGRYTPGQVSDVNEVAPPGWGHTKAEKEKTDPSKPKSKIGGTIAAMKRAQDRGDIPKKLNIFALAYSMKNKGAKPHYKPGTDEKYKKYQDEVKEGTKCDCDCGKDPCITCGKSHHKQIVENKIVDRMVAAVRKRKEERKPEKAMDAGARAKRKLARKVHRSTVSDFVPKELEDHKTWSDYKKHI